MAETKQELASPGLQSTHTFHIPVMGTGFTIDTPLKIARYGISSVISLVDDILIEQMRKFHCERESEPYDPIRNYDEDARARRITAYLDLVDRLVRRQVQTLQSSPFDAGGEITRYYEMLPESPLKQLYNKMLATTDLVEKARLQESLRPRAVPGSIDVNIMTKLDRNTYRNGEMLPPEFSDAMSALRGYANSSLHSSIIFSAGINPRLYSYVAQFNDFLPGENGILRKKVTLKVSDYHSAEVQGKFLAKRGLWVSEYRIESGLNCGGHAFANKGSLMGPILEEFKRRKEELVEELHTIYVKGLAARGLSCDKEPHKVRITAQGGIGTASEDQFLLKYFAIDSTGWATPFMLVPEIVNMDDIHMKKLSAATDSDVYLSDSSPLGVPFWNLRTSMSEEDRRRRIVDGKPGTPCPKSFLAANMEFTKVAICRASRAYQRIKLQHLSKENFSEEQLSAIKEDVLVKSCICHDLAGCVTVKYGIDPRATPAICCGPNIVNFSKIATLEEMMSHIYGRISLLTNPDRVHMFVRELMLNVDHLKSEIRKFSLGFLTVTPKYFHEYKENLLNGVEYYRHLSKEFAEKQRKRFLDNLKTIRNEIEQILL